MPIHLEVPVFGPSSAYGAAEAGASRIELNASGSYPQGGLTPSLQDLAQLATLTVSIRVMIRPRGAPPPPGKDFIYSGGELGVMERSILDFKRSGYLKAERGDGFVFGVLRENEGKQAEYPGSRTRLVADVAGCRQLVEAAHPYRMVFHRAFDDIVGCLPSPSHLGEALDRLVGLGFDEVLTSGGPGSAAHNIENLQRTLNAVEGRIKIIVGGGVRSQNVAEVTRRLKIGDGSEVSWVHSSCLLKADSEEPDEQEVKRILAAVDTEPSSSAHA